MTYGSGMVITTSGVPIFQPSVNRTGAGAVFASPSAAPLSAHLTSLSISSADIEGSVAMAPWGASANQGGMRFVRAASRIALAQSLVDVYVRNDIGPTSPGRWHPTHRL